MRTGSTRHKRLATMTVTAVCLWGVGGCGEKRTPPQVTVNGHTWFVDVAATAEQRYRGLSGRDTLADNVGMLFIYPEPGILKFCMRGCLIDLDIAFIDADMRVVGVHTMPREPDLLGTRVCSSSVPAQFALEVKSGSLSRAGVRPGDRVTFRGAIPDPAKAAPHP